MGVAQDYSKLTGSLGFLIIVWQGPLRLLMKCSPVNSKWQRTFKNQPTKYEKLGKFLIIVWHPPGRGSQKEYGDAHPIFRHKPAKKSRREG